MIAAGEIEGGNLLKIYGPISVLANYTLGHQVAHLDRAIAVSGTRLSAYVTVISSSLVAKINNGKQADGDRILRGAKTQLESLIHSGGLPGGKQPLKINGRTTVLASFFIASQLGHNMVA